MTFHTPPVSWMSKVTNGGGSRMEIIYTKFCYFDYCLKTKKSITINNTDHDDQCLPSRSGIACGQCAEGLSTIFGTSRCKKCSNFGLFAILMFAIVGC